MAKKNAEQYIAENEKSFKPGKVKTSHARELRFKDEVDFVNKFTAKYVTDLKNCKDNNFLTLQDIKNYLAQLEIHGLDPKSEMAQVHDDMVRLCVKGINIDGKKIRLVAKTVGTNRVAYFNVQSIRELVSKTNNKDQLRDIQSRLDIINKLTDRPGYQPK